MKLNQIELCRVAAFVDGLRIIAAKEQDRGIEVDQISTEGIKALQDYTVDRSSQYAKRNFPNLSFPDETEREQFPVSELLNRLPSFAADESSDLLGGTLAIRPGTLLGRC